MARNDYDSTFKRIRTFLKNNQWPDEVIEIVIDTLQSKEPGLVLKSVEAEKERVIVKYQEKEAFFIFKKDGIVQVCCAKR